MDHAHHHNHASDTNSGAQGMSHGSANVYLRRFWIVTALLVPLVAFHPAISEMTDISLGAADRWTQFVIATAIFYFSLVFFQHAWHEVRSRAYGMMTLVSLAVGSGYGFSVVSTFVPALHTEFYLEISTLIWVLLFGHYLEARSSSAAGDALSEVAKLLPKKAHRLEGGVQTDVEVDQLQHGDSVLVKPGEKIPADGIVVRGRANVDEALVSGESKPIQKGEGASVVAGSICLDGSLTVRLSRVGEHSTVGQIQKLIAQAAQTKPRSQRVADRASAVLTVVAGVTALGTLVVWTLVIGEPFVFALTLAITVLVIACPHALGLAIPTVTTITTSLAVRNGFFIKDLSVIETVRKADYVVFDKTGTLTKGEFGVTDIVSLGEGSTDMILSVAASLEQHSSHIIGQSIVRYAKEKGVSISESSDFKNSAGQGISATIGGRRYAAGNERLIREVDGAFEAPSIAVGTVVFVADEKNVLGYILLSDEIKDSSKRAVRALHDLGVGVAMLTGDNEQVARWVAGELAIDTYFADVAPDDKYRHIMELQQGGKTVVMVGDGVNDAPALTQADAGIAIGAGTDVAVEAGDIVLTDNDPYDVVRLVSLSQKAYGKMVQNLVWALGYNILAIPAAAGAFAAWGFFLRPEIGALLMSGSTVLVVANALLLRRARLD